MGYYQRSPTWHREHPFFKNISPPTLQPWLTSRGSLTHALICTCTDHFSVKVLKESWEKPTPSEQRALKLKPNSLAFVRQVHLYCGEKAWVYARTVIPKQTLQGELQKLTQLGTRPLGAILFANKHIQRGALALAKIPAKHSLHKRALLYSPKASTQIWGRRSLFYIANKPLIVSEIFLPNIHPKKQCITS